MFSLISRDSLVKVLVCSTGKGGNSSEERFYRPDDVKAVLNGQEGEMAFHHYKSIDGRMYGSGAAKTVHIFSRV